MCNQKNIFFLTILLGDMSLTVDKHVFYILETPCLVQCQSFTPPRHLPPARVTPHKWKLPPQSIHRDYNFFWKKPTAHKIFNAKIQAISVASMFFAHQQRPLIYQTRHRGVMFTRFKIAVSLGLAKVDIFSTPIVRNANQTN